MNRDTENSSTSSVELLSLFRGLYSRVARRLGVDASYVSRVARGQRSSAVVQAALEDEMKMLRANLNKASAKPSKSRPESRRAARAAD
jgi:transcriptional regulator with XRE-family HTH domain